MLALPLKPTGDCPGLGSTGEESPSRRPENGQDNWLGRYRRYMRPKDLARRWVCSRTQVDRIARRAGLRRTCLGEGKNGMVLYLREEVEAYEKSRRVRMS